MANIATNFIYNCVFFHGSKWTNNENYTSHLVTLVSGLIRSIKMSRPLFFPFCLFYTNLTQIKCSSKNGSYQILKKFNGPFPSSFSLYFRSFNVSLIQLIVNQICQCLDSNHGSLVVEGTALPAEPQPLPNI